MLVPLLLSFQAPLFHSLPCSTQCSTDKLSFSGDCFVFKIRLPFWLKLNWLRLNCNRHHEVNKIEDIVEGTCTITNIRVIQVF